MLKDFNSKTVGIFGAGFVGENVIKKLAKSGHRIKIASRNPYLKQNLKLLGEMGQIELIKINNDKKENKAVLFFVTACLIRTNSIFFFIYFILNSKFKENLSFIFKLSLSFLSLFSFSTITNLEIFFFRSKRRY